MKGRSGLTIFEILVFVVLFTVGFIPGHLVAQKAGIGAGLGIGIVCVLLLRIILGQGAILMDRTRNRKPSKEQPKGQR